MNALLLLACLAQASDAKTPYRVRLIVSVQKHPLLTPIFKEQATRRLRDAVQAGLGDVARVQVDGGHPLHAAIEEQGLDRAVGASRVRDGFLTYCVRLGYSGTNYEIESRMHDGLTGLPEPVLHRDRTRDRAFVSRLAALLLSQGLGLHGTIVGEPAAGQVKLEMRGGELGSDLSRWVKKGSVFAVMKVPEVGQARQQPFTCLQAKGPPTRGMVDCWVWSNNPDGVRPWTGAVAVLLPTRKGSLRLRPMLQTPTGLAPLEGQMPIRIRNHSFEGEDGGAIKATARGDRDFDTSKRPDGTFDRLAFITLLDGKFDWKYPVPILDERIVLLPVSPGSLEANAARTRHEQLMAKAADSLKVQAAMFEDINRLTKDPKTRAAAIARVRETLKRGKEDHDSLQRERADLESELGKLDAKSRPSLAPFDSRLKELRRGDKELMDTVVALEKIESLEPKRKEWEIQLKQAQTRERQGDIEEALKLYAREPAEFKDEAVGKHAASLAAKWAIKGDEHRRARQFAYEEWAGLPTARLKEGIQKAHAALTGFRIASDPFGPVRLRTGALKHVERMVAESDKLREGVNAGDAEAAEKLRELKTDLQKLVNEIEELIAKEKG